MSREVISYATDDGFVVAIIGPPGRIYTPMVFIDSPVKRYMVANGDVAKYRRELPVPYKVKRAAQLMLKAGKKLGITRAAKKFLRACW